MNLIRKRIRKATQDYDLLFNATEKFICDKFNVSSLDKVMEKIAENVLDSTSSKDKEHIMREIMYASADVFSNTGLAAIENNDNCKAIAANIPDINKFMENVEAQVQVKALNNMSLAEKLVDDYLTNQKAASRI